MKRGLEWYKRDPRAMIDAKRAANDSMGMTVRQAAVYDLVTDLIYEGAGETPNNPQHVASHFSDMGTRAARETIAALIAMGKLTERGSMLVNERASEQAQSRTDVSQKRADAGRKGGKASGETRRKLAENSAETQRKPDELAEFPPTFHEHSKEFSEVKLLKTNGTEEANASSKIQPEKRREEKSYDDDDDAGARARSSPPKQIPDDGNLSVIPDDFREQLLQSLGVDPVSGLTGHGCARLGTLSDMQDVSRWFTDLGLGAEAILAVVSEVMAKRQDRGPPSSLRYFTKPMQAYAGALRSPKLKPTPLTQGEQNAKSSFTAEVHDLAKRLSSGESQWPTASRDPFATRPGGDSAPDQRSFAIPLRPNDG